MLPVLPVLPVLAVLAVLPVLPVLPVMSMLPVMSVLVTASLTILSRRSPAVGNAFKQKCFLIFYFENLDLTFHL